MTQATRPHTPSAAGTILLRITNPTAVVTLATVLVIVASTLLTTTDRTLAPA